MLRQLKSLLAMTHRDRHCELKKGNVQWHEAIFPES